MLAYKLFNRRKNGTIGSLFVNRKAVLPVGFWLEAEDHKPLKLAHRPGWHCTAKPVAPHLSSAGREWYAVEIDEFRHIPRPLSQGGTWMIANKLKILNPIKNKYV